MRHTPRSRRHSTTIELDVEIGYQVEGRYIAATRLDPAEYPEIEIDRVEVVALDKRGATRIDLLAAIPQATIEELRREIEDQLPDDEEERAAYDEDQRDGARGGTP